MVYYLCCLFHCNSRFQQMLKFFLCVMRCKLLYKPIITHSIFALIFSFFPYFLIGMILLLYSVFIEHQHESITQLHNGKMLCRFLTFLNSKAPLICIRYIITYEVFCLVLHDYLFHKTESILMTPVNLNIFIQRINKNLIVLDS